MVPRKKFDVQPLTPDTPIYPIGVAAKILDVHPRTLRIYEDEGLISPAHKGARRMFSENDIKWVNCLRKLIHEQGVSIPGLKKLLTLAPCWEVADCPVEIHAHCNALIDKAAPRRLRLAGDEQAEAEAKQAERRARENAGQHKKKTGQN
ncbi:MAG: MerR family transcriptional regulator [Proteobacteria bacterium]|nr:MerR family transcriptional regulator [Pseudomonadota bacterium]MBU1737774.1 MerR family transcriptional regulator [Pseudomonadota bacterium]